jgi:hypothetical protein
VKSCLSLALSFKQLCSVSSDVVNEFRTAAATSSPPPVAVLSDIFASIVRDAMCSSALTITTYVLIGGTGFIHG